MKTARAVVGAMKAMTMATGARWVDAVAVVCTGDAYADFASTKLI
jgi:hypothetical protein